MMGFLGESQTDISYGDLTPLWVMCPSQDPRVSAQPHEFWVGVGGECGHQGLAQVHVREMKEVHLLYMMGMWAILVL